MMQFFYQFAQSRIIFYSQTIAQMESDSLDIIHFNDVYNIEPNKHGDLGFVNFYAHVQQLRKQYPRSLMAFSGDCFAPSKLSRVLKGEQMAHCIKQLGIDVACYGNHQFDLGIQQLEKLVKDCSFPWLLGNVKYKQTGINLGNGLDYHIMTHQGIKIGFLGLAGPDFNGRMISQYKDKLQYYQLCGYATQVCKTLLKEGCELIIALTHCRKPADLQLANAVPEIDIILGGHDHHVLATSVKNTPIVKSGSDFQYLSLVRIMRKELKAELNFTGKRWNFQVQSLKIPKRQTSYPQLQDYVSWAVGMRKEYEQRKNAEANPKKQKCPEIPKSDWLLQYKLHNNRPTVTLRAGLSAEICLAKYIAFKREYFYCGYNRATPQHNPNHVSAMLDYIYQQYRAHANTGKTVLYSPGICNVPYLVQTCNFVYLPSHFLVGVTSIAHLEEILTTANKEGYKCYAVLGYDPFFKKQLCAWIKFIEAPKQYLKLISQLKIQSVVLMSVHDRSGSNHGAQRNCRLISGFQLQKPRQSPQPEDIYMNFIQEADQVKLAKEIDVIAGIISDYPLEFWREVVLQKKCQFMHDWESGIDCLQSSQLKHLKFYIIAHRQSWNLYLSAYHLGKAFIAHNYLQKQHEVKAKGIVFNQYFMSNPTYELNYGYIPIIYWQFYPQNQQRILAVLNEDERKYKRWFNNNKGMGLQLVAKDSHVINTDNLGKELGHWVTKHAPKGYNLKYLPLGLFLQIMEREGLVM